LKNIENLTLKLILPSPTTKSISWS